MNDPKKKMFPLKSNCSKIHVSLKFTTWIVFKGQLASVEHVQNSFYLAKLKLYSPEITTPHPPFPGLRQPPFCFLSLWLWLFSIPHVNRIMQCLSLGKWPLSLSTRSSRCLLAGLLWPHVQKRQSYRTRSRKGFIICNVLSSVKHRLLKNPRMWPYLERAPL